MFVFAYCEVCGCRIFPKHRVHSSGVGFCSVECWVKYGVDEARLEREGREG